MEPEPNSNASQIVGSNTDNLFAVIDRQNVHGLNITVPEDAKETIKPWDERETTEKFADSNVDDQVGRRPQLATYSFSRLRADLLFRS